MCTGWLGGAGRDGEGDGGKRKKRGEEKDHDSSNEVKYEEKLKETIKGRGEEAGVG